MFDFTRASYLALLSRFKEGHAFLTFREMGEKPTADRYVLLRHDVDYSPKAALELAELEAKDGVKSTYFFLLSSPYYNLLSAELCRIPAQITALGHEVGLHYDVEALVARANGDDLVKALREEAELLSLIVGKRVASVACHNPSLLMENPISGLAPFQDAYANAFASTIPYLSDSCRAWRDNAVRALTAKDLPARLQLLIHPILWTGTAKNRWDWLTDYFGARARELAVDCERTRQMWLEHSGVKEHDRRVQAERATTTA